MNPNERMASLPSLLKGVTDSADWENRRRELLKILMENEYGVTPPAVTARGKEGRHERCYAGMAEEWDTEITFDTPKGLFSFPVHTVLPNEPRPCPAIVLINFRPDCPDRYWPTEELVNRGYAVARIFYGDVTSDDGNMSDGLAGCFGLDNPSETSMGKIGCWAYACSRCLDYLLTLPEIDPKRIAVAGHSRLGKTSLWAAAQDERFAISFVNCSGAGGDAIFRDKIGETAADLDFRFPFWFCPKFGSYSHREKEMPFDQHFVIAAMAPRPVVCCTAEEDSWADPNSELLACGAASPAWELFGYRPLEIPEQPLSGKVELMGDRIGFSFRPGSHFFSRKDWDFYLRYWEQLK